MQSQIINDVSQTPSIQRNPKKFLEIKAAAVPLSVMGYSFIYYLIKSKHPDVYVSSDMFGEDYYNLDNHSLPFVVIRHEKSYKQPKNSRLLEYYQLLIWVSNDKEGRLKLAKLTCTIQSKLWGLIIKEVAEGDILKVEMNLYIKSYLFCTQDYSIKD